MAIYRPGTTPPGRPQRIDGQIWQTNAPTPTIRGWVYPTMHPSDRFKTCNTLAIQMDILWDQVSPTNQALWAATANLYNTAPMGPCYPGRLWSICDLFTGDRSTMTALEAGKDYHRAVNVQRALAGEEYTDLPPATISEYGTNQFFRTYPEPWHFTYTSTGCGPSQQFTQTYSGIITQREIPPLPSYSRRYKYWGTLTEYNGITANARSIIEPQLVKTPGKIVNIAVGIAAPGDSPFYTGKWQGAF